MHCPSGNERLRIVFKSYIIMAQGDDHTDVFGPSTGSKDPSPFLSSKKVCRSYHILSLNRLVDSGTLRYPLGPLGMSGLQDPGGGISLWLGGAKRDLPGIASLPGMMIMFVSLLFMRVEPNHDCIAIV